MKKSFLIIIAFSFLSACIADKGKVSINIKKSSKNTPTQINASVSTVKIINNQLVITGNGLDTVSKVSINGNSVNETFSIETQSATKIIANSIHAFSFDVSKIFNLILSDAEASASFQIDFALCNATLNGKGFDCSPSIVLQHNDVLSYDSGTKKWKPRAINNLSYVGLLDASGALPTAGPAGQYYIVSVGGNGFSEGDWAVSNGTSFDQVNNATYVTKVFGRTGDVEPEAGDYSLDMLADVNINPTAGDDGKVLKYDHGTGKWILAVDNSGGGASSVTTSTIVNGAVTDAKIDTVSASKITGTINSTQILDGTIVNADIAAGAAIDYSKLNIPNTSIPYAKLNIADGDIPAAKIGGLPSATAVLATSIADGDTTHAPDGNAIFDALVGKIGTTGGTLTTGTINGVPGPVAPDDIVNKDYVDDQDALLLLKTGGTLSVGTISGIPTPTNGDDVANKSYVDLKVGNAGGAGVLVPGNAKILMKTCPATWTENGTTGAGPQAVTCGTPGSATSCKICQNGPTASELPASSIVLMENCPSDWISLGTITGPASGGREGGQAYYTSCQSPAADALVPQNSRFMMATCPSSWKYVGKAPSSGSSAASCDGAACDICEAPGALLVTHLTPASVAATDAGLPLFLIGGAGGSTSGAAGEVTIKSGSTTSGNGGHLTMSATSAAVQGNGGDVRISSGVGAGTGVDGKIIINSNGGNVVIGASTTTYKLDVQGGDINTSGNVRAVAVVLSSDKRWKREIRPLENSLDKLKRLSGVSYVWAINEFPEKHFSDEKQIGVIAQDVQAVFPELVATDHNGFLSVNYPGLIAPLIEAIKDQQKQIAKNLEMFEVMKSGIYKTLNAHAREIASIKKENAELKKLTKELSQENTAIKAYLCSRDKSASICK